MNRRVLLLILLLAATCTAARAQVAADETWRLAATVASPWGAPLGPALPDGTTMRLAPTALEGPAPIECPGATHTFVRSPAAGLFEGNLPAPADQSAKALGLPDAIVTQRITCANGGFDVHRAADGRAWIGLDNAVLRWERVSIVASPEATVQSLLVQHMAGSMAVSPASVAAQSAWLSKALIDKLDRWFARVRRSDEVPELNGDPYTDSQESPESFELAPARVQGERAELTVTFRDSAMASYPVHMQLVRVQDVWRLDDVRYRNGQRLSQLLAQ